MAEKDIAEKTLFDYPDVTADVMNVLMFQGKRIVRPEELITGNPLGQYKIAGDLHEEIRDTVKYWKKENRIIALIGIEQETETEKYMPIRVFGYDGTSYLGQIVEKREKDRKRRKTNQKKRKLEVYPVATMVLYYGMRAWKYSRHLKDLLEVSEDLKPYVSDYEMKNLFEIAYLSPEQVRMFESDFRIVADYFVQMRMYHEYEPGTQPIIHVDAVLKLMTVLTKRDWRNEVIEKMKEEGKEITMVSAYAEVEQRGINKGIELGRKQMKSQYEEAEKRAVNEGINAARRENALKMLKSGKLDLNDISDYSGLSLSEVIELKSSL